MISQFGKRISGVSYIQRPGVYAVIVNSRGEVAVIKDGDRYHLPGGGIHSRELPGEAVKREILEETGLVSRSEEIIGTANQYCCSLIDRKYYNKLCSYFLVRKFNEHESFKEAEHKIFWKNFDNAERILDHESHAWAVSKAALIIIPAASAGGTS